MVQAIPENITTLLLSVVLCQRQQMSDILCGIAWYYGDNDFIIRTFDFIACSDAVHMTFSMLMQILTRLVVLIWILV